MNEEKDERDEAIELLTEKIDLLAVVLETLANAWFPSFLELDIDGIVRGYVMWQAVTNDLEELVGILHDQFGEGSFDEAISKQISALESEAEEFEKVFNKLEGQRQNAENN